MSIRSSWPRSSSRPINSCGVVPNLGVNGFNHPPRHCGAGGYLALRRVCLGWWKLHGQRCRGMIDENELMSGREIAEKLGWRNSGTAATLWRRGTFPAPLVDKSHARLWRRVDVEEWERTAHRRPWRRAES